MWSISGSDSQDDASESKSDSDEDGSRGGRDSVADGSEGGMELDGGWSKGGTASHNEGTKTESDLYDLGQIGSDSDEDSRADKTEKEDGNHEHDTLATKEEVKKETGGAEVSDGFNLVVEQNVGNGQKRKGKNEAERLKDNLSYLSQSLPTKRSRQR